MFPFGKKQTTDANADRPRVAVVIAAAGSSTRMGGENKLLLPIDGIPVLARTLLAFAQSAVIDDIVLVCRAQDFNDYNDLLSVYQIDKVKSILVGGATRAHSVRKGIAACEFAEIVAIHDGARPLVSQEIITNCVQLACKTGAAAPIVPMKDSVKRVKNGIIEADVPRDKIGAVQTPQVFRRDLIERALHAAIADNLPLTDDCSAMEHAGMLVHAVEGDYRNMKITTPEDIAVAETLLAMEQA